MDERDREPTTPTEGPSPTDDDDQGETMEELISDMDRPWGSVDHTTAEEQREGDSIDERTRREQPERERPDERLDLTEDDALDEEPQLVGEEAEALGPQAPEQAAMHVVDEAPGATDHPDDYVDDDAR